MRNPLNIILKPFGLEIKAAAATDSSGWFYDYWNGGVKTDAGVNISNETSLQISAVYACMKVISEDVAKLPIGVFEKLATGRERLPDHPLAEILNVQPNMETLAMSFRNSIIGNALSYGNGYAEIVRDGFGTVTALWLLNPQKVIPKRNEAGLLYYQVTNDNGQIRKVQREKIFHVPGFGFDGIQGYNVVTLARQSLGLARGAEKFGAKFFGNGAKTSGVLELPDAVQLTEKAHGNLQRSIERNIAGDNVHKILIAEQGAKFKTMSLSQKDSQYLETRQFSIPEICRWFRVQPHKIFDLTHATFSNIEEQNTDYVTDALMPWFVRFEQAVHCQLLTPADRLSKIYVRHNANALMRGDAESRAVFYNSGIMAGWMTRNEARELEELNPIDGLDAPLMPLNMIAVGEEPVDMGTNDAFVEDIAHRITTAEERGLAARVGKANDDRDRFNEWVNAFYEKHEVYALKCIAPLGLSQKTADQMTVEGILNIAMSDDPAAHIKTWNRKQEIIDIIQEALTCTHK